MAKLARYDIVLVGDDQEMVRRVKGICDEFSFTMDVVANMDALAEVHIQSQVGMVLFSAGHIEDKNIVAGHVQVARQIMQDAFVFVSVARKMDSKSADWIKKSGADVVVLENEVFETSKLDFISVQRLKTAYMPAKPSDFRTGQKVDFNVYYLLPQNQKFMPVVHKGMVLDEKRVKKLADLGEIYIKRPDIVAYNKHVQDHPDLSASGLFSRCRAQFLLLSVSYADLVMVVTGQSESASFEEGKEILEKVKQFSSEVLTGLMSAGRVWDIVNNSAIGDFGSIERGPTRAAYAGYFSLMGSIGKPEEVMLASLFADTGLITMQPKSIKKIRDLKMLDFTSEERMDYEQHPLRSLNLILSRKLQLSQEVKDAVQFSHARYDKKGFPSNINPEKISQTAQLTHFCQILDDRCQVRLGQAPLKFQDVFNQIIANPDSASIFGFSFINAMKKVEIL